MTKSEILSAIAVMEQQLEETKLSIRSKGPVETSLLIIIPILEEQLSLLKAAVKLLDTPQLIG